MKYTIYFLLHQKRKDLCSHNNSSSLKLWYYSYLSTLIIIKGLQTILFVKSFFEIHSQVLFAVFTEIAEFFTYLSLIF